MTTDSVDGCSILLETQFVGSRLHVNTTWILSVGVPFPYVSCRREARVDIKPPLGAPLLIFPPEVFEKRLALARQQGFEFRIFPLLGELPKAIEAHLPETYCVMECCCFGSYSTYVFLEPMEDRT